MKTLEHYIIEKNIETLNEGLIGKLVSWFKNIFKSQKQLIKNNKPVSFDVDTKEIKGPKKPCNLDQILSNKEELGLINDKIVGFPITADIIKNKNKYLLTEDKKEYKPQVNRFFINEDKNVYSIAYTMFDDTIVLIDGYRNVLDLEVLANVANFSEVQKFVCTTLEEDVKKANKKGLIYNVKNPRLKAIFTKLGFSSSKENNDWLIKNIK